MKEKEQRTSAFSGRLTVHAEAGVIRKDRIKQMLPIGQAGWRFEQREQEMKTLTYRAF